MRTAICCVAGLALVVSFAGCNTDAEVASSNLSQAARMFEVNRRAVFYNSITDTYILTIEGLLNIHDQGNQLEVVVKTGEDQYKKHFLGLSDNVTYFCEQIEPTSASPYHYRVVFKPASIVPDIDADVESVPATVGND